MGDYVIDGSDKIYNVWKADKTTRLHKNELLRHNHLLNLILGCDGVKNIIDIGCGTGYLDYLLSLNGKKITAVDLSAKRLSLFKEVADKQGIKQINSDLFNLNEDGYDFVISQEVLEHLDDYESALVKMNSFVKQDGFGLFCVPYKENLEAKMITDPKTGERYHKVGHLHSFDENKFEAGIKKAGFSLIKTKVIVSKRTFKLFAKYNLSINKFALEFDNFMTFLNKDKSAYLAVLCKKK